MGNVRLNCTKVYAASIDRYQRVIACNLALMAQSHASINNLMKELQR